MPERKGLNMKINMWIIYSLLPYDNMTTVIRDDIADIQYARIAAESDLRNDTVYVGDGKEYYGSHDIAIIHRNNYILIDNKKLYDVFNRVATIIDRFSSWEKRLSNDVRKENGIQEMLDSAQAFLPGGYYALSLTGKTLGLSCPDDSSIKPIWDEIFKYPDLTYDHMTNLDNYFDFSRFKYRGNTFTAKTKDDSFYYTVTSFGDNEDTAGFLVYCSNEFTTVRGLEIIANELVHNIKQYFSYHVGTLNLTSKNSDMLMKLIDGGNESDEARAFFSSIKWMPNNEYTVIAVNTGTSGRSSDIIMECRSIFTLPLFCAIKEDLIILINVSKEQDYEDKILRFRNLMTDENRCGISKKYHYLYQASLYCKQAVYELRKAENVLDNCSFASSHENNYYMEQLMNAPLSNAYLNRSLISLLPYDIANNTEYYLTLRAYILSFFHTSDASKLLNIHRNTFLYRLEQIRSIIDFSEFDKMIQEPDIERMKTYYISISVIDEIMKRVNPM
jgi:hypothetical protein